MKNTMKKTDLKKVINFDFIEKQYNLFVKARNMKERFLTDDKWVDTFIDFCIDKGLITEPQEFKYEMSWCDRDMFRTEILWKQMWFRLFTHQHNFTIEDYDAMEELVKVSKK
jgi:hypothetical protein